jgi:predicted dinucleotide-binding enzyme
VFISVSSDDPAAKDTVIHLSDQLGFDGIAAGSLDESRRQEPGTPVYTTDLDVEGARNALAVASPQQTTAWRERPTPYDA